MGERTVAECVYAGCDRDAVGRDLDGDAACRGCLRESLGYTPGGARIARDPASVSWRHLTLNGGQDYQGREIDPESTTGVELLRGYREDGSIWNVWLGSDAEIALAEACGIDSADFGPRVDEIDWEGFPG